MLCARCHKKQASVFIKQIVDNQVSETHLCLDCAQLEAPEAAAPSLAGLLSLLGAPPRARPPAARCKACGLSWSEFTKTGFLGCPGCYDSFAGPLKAVLQEMQGAERHGGKRPGGRPKAPPAAAEAPSDDPPALEKRLSEALAREDYELAAKLRDRLKKARG